MITREVMRIWPGDTVDAEEEGSQGQDGYQEPGEDDAHHHQAKQHQGEVLQQHFSLHGETYVNFGEETYCVSDTLREFGSVSACELYFCGPPKWFLAFIPSKERMRHSGVYKILCLETKSTIQKSPSNPQINMSNRDTSEVDNRKPLPQAKKPTLCLGTTPCQAGWLHWLRALLRERFPVKTNQASPSSMSLEKRVRIRPRGVVSKKRMGLRRSRRNSLSCSTEAAFTVHCQHKQQQPRLNRRPDTCKQTTLRSIRKESWLG